MTRRVNRPRFWVTFPTGQKYPIRYMDTSDQYEVELPCGVFGGSELNELRHEIKANFIGARITK